LRTSAKAARRRSRCSPSGRPGRRKRSRKAAPGTKEHSGFTVDCKTLENWTTSGEQDQRVSALWRFYPRSASLYAQVGYSRLGWRPGGGSRRAAKKA
jgi:hypothetical protein